MSSDDTGSRSATAALRHALDPRLAQAGRMHAPSAARNVEPILNALRGRLPAAGRALEIASGTGQHVVALARAFPDIDWTPSDPDPTARASIAAWIEEAGVANVRSPLDLDVTRPHWFHDAPAALEACLAINLLHIAPWAATEGLMRGAGALLRPAGLLGLYGPYRRDGEHTAPSNAAFDADLRARNRDWGVRDIADVSRVARDHGLALIDVVAMPANNFSLFFRRQD